MNRPRHSFISSFKALLTLSILTQYCLPATGQPTDIILTNEVVYSGTNSTVVGNLYAVDSNSSITHTFGLVDNFDIFTIEGNILKITKPSDVPRGIYNTRIRTYDGVGFYEKLFSIRVASGYPIFDAIGYGVNSWNYKVISAPTPEIKVDDLFFSRLKESQSGKYWSIWDGSRTEPLTVNSTFVAGNGYWVLTNPNKFGYAFGLTTELPVDLNGRGEYELQLEGGWNLIGNPFRVDLNWNDVMEYNLMMGYVPEGYVSSEIYIYDKGYQGTGTIRVFEGAYVKASFPLTLYLKVPIASGARMETHSHSHIGSNQWQIDITMSNEHMSTNLCGFGMMDTALDGLDMLDRNAPPVFSKDMLFQWEDVNGISKNIISPKESFMWEYKVLTSNQPTTFSWDKHNSTLIEEELWMELYPQGRFIDMRKIDEVTFTPNKDQLVRIYYGILPTMFTCEAYPNPSFDFVNLRLSSSISGLATVVVRNIHGQQVAKTYHEISVGHSEWKWERRKADGSTLPPGIYFCELSLVDQRPIFIKLILY